jgi:antitoxin HicB
MLSYAVTLTPDDNETLTVQSPDLPMVITFGDGVEDALRHARDAFETAIGYLIDQGGHIPRPTARRGLQRVALPLLTALKLQLYWALQEEGITRAELARRLGWNRESVDRLFRLNHRSRLEQIEDAFAALRRRVDLAIESAA